MKFVVIGINYIGLSLAVVLAQKYDVVIADSSVKKVADINGGKCPFENQGLDEALKNSSLKLKASVDLAECCEDADFIIITTPTSFDNSANIINTNLLDKMLSRVLKYNSKALIVLRTTIPVGYTDKMSEKHNTKRIVYFPEFIREYRSLGDTQYPSRLIIGTVAAPEVVMEKVDEFLGAIRDTALKKTIIDIKMTAKEAEATKLFVNTYIAMRVQFFNEFDTFAEMRNMETEKMFKAILTDPIIGKETKAFGSGYGACYLPRETRRILIDEDYEYENPAERIVNESRTKSDFVNDLLSNDDPITVGIFMLSKYKRFDALKKYDIDNIIKSLIARGKNVIVFDPSIKEFNYCGARVVKGLENFKSISDVIITDKVSDDLANVSDKIFTPEAYIKIAELKKKAM